MRSLEEIARDELPELPTGEACDPEPATMTTDVDLEVFALAVADAIASNDTTVWLGAPLAFRIGFHDLDPATWLYAAGPTEGPDSFAFAYYAAGHFCRELLTELYDRVPPEVP